MYQEIKDQVTTTLHKACVIAVGGAVNQLCIIQVPRQTSTQQLSFVLHELSVCGTVCYHYLLCLTTALHWTRSSGSQTYLFGVTTSPWPLWRRPKQPIRSCGLGAVDQRRSCCWQHWQHCIEHAPVVVQAYVWFNVTSCVTKRESLFQGSAKHNTCMFTACVMISGKHKHVWIFTIASICARGGF